MDMVNASNHSGTSTNITLPDIGSVIIIPKWCDVVMTVYLFITGFLAITGNFLILTVEVKNKLKTSTDWLISFMGANDILFAMYNIPVYIIFHLGSWKSLASDVNCKLHYFVELTTMFSSAVLLGTVAVDRYFKTCRPHSRFLTAPRALRTCVAVTIISGVLNSPVLLTVIYDRTRDSLCGSKIYVGGLLNGLLHSLFIVAFIIMFIVVCICYAKVAYTIKTKLIQNDAKNSKNTEQSKESVLKSKTTLSTNLALTNNGNKDLVFEHKKKIKINKVVPVADGGTGDTADHEGLFDLPSATFDTHSATCSTEVDKASKSTELLSIQSSKLVTNNKQKERKRMADTRVDRTTKIMFAVTMVFLLSWIPTWSHYFYILLSREDTVAGEVYKFFARKAYMVNTFTNPFFYIWLSSAFKERTRKVLKPLRGLLKIRRSAP